MITLETKGLPVVVVVSMEISPLINQSCQQSNVTDVLDDDVSCCRWFTRDLRRGNNGVLCLANWLDLQSCSSSFCESRGGFRRRTLSGSVTSTSLSLSLSLDEKGIQLKNVPLTSLKAADASLQCNCLILSKRWVSHYTVFWSLERRRSLGIEATISA